MAQKKKECEIIERFEHCFVVEDIFPVSKGHLLIISKEHFEHWFLAPRLVQHDIIKAANQMKALLDKKYHPDGYNFGFNCGVAAGEEIMHLHAHLIPRYEGDMNDPQGGIRGVIPEKQKGYIG